MKFVGAREANQKFSKLLAEVEKGEVFVITKRGYPVALFVPKDADIRKIRRQLDAHLRKAKGGILRPRGGGRPSESVRTNRR